MGATLSALDAILMDDYHGPIVDQLNQEVVAYDLFKKAKVSWAGRQAIFPVHVSRNSGVEWSSAGTLPTAGNQGFEKLAVTAAKLYGVVELDGDLLAAAAKGGKRAFMAAMSVEVEGMAKDVARRLNQATFSGHQLCGYINEHKVEAGVATWQYAGDTAKLAAAVASGATTVSIIRMDTYATVATVACTVVDAVNMEITLAALNTSAVATGFGCAVKIATSGAGIVTALQSQMKGIYANLSEPTHFGVDRTDATGETELQSNILTANQAGDHAKTDITLPIIERTLMTVEENAGEQPDCILVHHTQKQKYAAIFQGSIQVDGSADAGKIAGAAATASYGKLQIKASVDCGKGLACFLRLDSWRLAELEEGNWESRDGSVWSRVAGSDKLAAYWKTYLNVVCVKPKASAILCGLNHA